MLSEIGIARRVTRTAERFTPEVSVVGRLSSTGGIETAARRYLHALNTAGLRTRAVDLPDDGTTRSTESGEEGSINLLCFDLPSYFAARSSLATDFFRDRYNIGMWPWELPVFPSSWFDRFAYHDEVWAPSSFIASVLGPISPIPVVRIPHVLTSELTGSRTAGRRKIGAEDEEVIFAFIFNSFSSYARKNPLAIIDAFTTAFGPDEPARLVIKCAHSDYDRSGFAEMNLRAQGRRISIYGENWSAQEIADLTAACDCYVSLHRGEGVG